MKLYYVKNIETPNMVKMLLKYHYTVYDIDEYIDGVAVLIITTDNIHNIQVHHIVEKYKDNSNFFFILNDANEAYPWIHRTEYLVFYDILNKFKINRNRGIVAYNNAIKSDVSYYKSVGFRTIYFPTFFFENSDWSMDTLQKLRDTTPKTNDFSFFVRKGKPHKSLAAKYVIDNNYDVLMTYSKNRDFESDVIQTLDTDEYDFHLANENHFKSKIDLLIESEYESYPQKIHTWWIPENEYFDKTLHLTEKVWRNISFAIPFVIIGSKFSLKHLRDIGFKTFNTLIDESYDSMDDSIRLENALIQGKELLKYWGSDELNKILDFNQQLYSNMKFKRQKLYEYFLLPISNYIEKTL